MLWCINGVYLVYDIFKTMSAPAKESKMDSTTAKTEAKTERLTDEEANAEAVRVWKTDGEKALFKYLMTDPDTGAALSYAESRMRFG